MPPRARFVTLGARQTVTRGDRGERAGVRSAQPCEKAADDRRLTQAETADLTKRATARFKSLDADEVTFEPIAKNTMRIWWD